MLIRFVDYQVKLELFLDAGYIGFDFIEGFSLFHVQALEMASVKIHLRL